MTYINELENQFDFLGKIITEVIAFSKTFFSGTFFILEDALSAWTKLGGRVLFVWLIRLWHRCNDITRNIACLYERYLSLYVLEERWKTIFSDA